jgi:iron complex transport system substrate-binding protein
MRRPIRSTALLLALAGIFVAGCGDDSSAPAASGGAIPTAPAASGSGSGSGSAPQRIVSLSSTATETLFAIGAGRQVVAVDDQSNYPAEAPKSDLSGYTPNIEAIAAKKPDLVVLSTDTDGLKGKLEALKITVVRQDAAKTLDEAYAQITELGKVTGHDKEAASTVASMKTSIDASKKKVSKPAVPVKVYHELDNTLFSVSSKSFVGELYTMLGLTNIADAADKDGTGYPQLSAEYLIAQNPDFIFLADTKCCAQNAKSIAARPGWAELKAVKAGNVIELDDDIASRWGPRTPQLFDAIATAAAKLLHS